MVRALLALVCTMAHAHASVVTFNAETMGKVMGALMKARRGQVDGGRARKLVQEALQG